MNFGDMQARVRTVVLDDQSRFITTDDIKQWLNEAQRDLAARTRILQKRAVGNVAAGSVIPLPADMLSLHFIKLTGATREVEMVDDAVYMAWLDEAGDPGFTIARTYAGNFELYPAATGTAYTLEYEYSPADLAADGDISPLPEHLHVKMVNYARAHALWKDDRNGANYMALYEQGLPQSTLGKPRLHPVPLTLGFAPGPFDTSEAIHN